MLLLVISFDLGVGIYLKDWLYIYDYFAKPSYSYIYIGKKGEKKERKNRDRQVEKVRCRGIAFVLLLGFIYKGLIGQTFTVQIGKPVLESLTVSHILGVPAITIFIAVPLQVFRTDVVVNAVNPTF